MCVCVCVCVCDSHFPSHCLKTYEPYDKVAKRTETPRKPSLIEHMQLFLLPPKNLNKYYKGTKRYKLTKMKRIGDKTPRVERHQKNCSEHRTLGPKYAWVGGGCGRQQGCHLVMLNRPQKDSGIRGTGYL